MATIASRSSSDRVRGITAERAAPGRGRAKGKIPSVGEGLQRLSRVEAGPHRVVSCYLKLEPRDRSRNKYLIKLKNRVREVVAALPRLGLPRSVQMEVERDLERVQAYFATPANLPDTHGGCKDCDCLSNTACQCSATVDGHVTLTCAAP